MRCWLSYSSHRCRLMLRDSPEPTLDDISVSLLVPGRGRSSIVDRDKRGKPPGESSSFDLAKMSVADVAAAIAQRMARARRARKAPDAPARAPPAAGPAAQSPAAQPGANRRPAFASQEAM